MGFFCKYVVLEYRFPSAAPIETGYGVFLVFHEYSFPSAAETGYMFFLGFHNLLSVTVLSLGQGLLNVLAYFLVINDTQ